MSCVSTTPSCRSCLRSVIGFRPGFLFSWQFTQEIYAASCCCNSPNHTWAQIKQTTHTHTHTHINTQITHTHSLEEGPTSRLRDHGMTNESLCLLCWDRGGGGGSRVSPLFRCSLHFTLIKAALTSHVMFSTCTDFTPCTHLHLPVTWRPVVRDTLHRTRPVLHNRTSHWTLNSGWCRHCYSFKKTHTTTSRWSHSNMNVALNVVVRLWKHYSQDACEFPRVQNAH